MAFFIKLKIMACDTPFIDCEKTKAYGIKQLFRLLLVKLVGDVPAVRVCIANADEVGGLNVKDHTADGGEITLELDVVVRKAVAMFKNGSLQHGVVGYTVGDATITFPAMSAGAEYTFLY